MKAKRGKLVHEPYGVIGIIAPWNYPFSTPALEALQALATGNAVVLKPSEFTPLVAKELERMFLSSGLDSALLQVVAGEGATGAALLESPIDKLIFTGSVATGKRVGEAAARRLLPVVLELGSKDPMLVLDDANLEVASSGAVWFAFMNAGQTCLSLERCYVHRSLYEPFLQKCKEKIAKLRVGNGIGSDVEIGPMIHERQLKIVETQVNDAVRRGARLLAGGGRLSELGPNFYAPTLLADVSNDMLIMQEETFGPVLPVAAFDSDEEAIRLANDSDFGLAASVWTQDRKRGERVAARVKAGAVMVNDMISSFGIAEAPHGGFKQSGIGRAHGEMGFAGNGADQVHRCRSDVRHSETVVVRLQPTIPGADGRVSGFAVCQKNRYEVAGSVAVCGTVPAVKSDLMVEVRLPLGDRRRVLVCAFSSAGPPSQDIFGSSLTIPLLFQQVSTQSARPARFVSSDFP